MITRVNGPASIQKTNVTSFSISMPQPSNGNVLIACIGLCRIGYIVTVSSITQTGVTWQKTVNNGDPNGTTETEIWNGTVTSSSASTTATITLTGNNPYYTVVDVCEYSGIQGEDSGRIGWNGGAGGTTDTGTTGQTTQADELWIGATTYSSGTYGQINPTNGFTLLDGQKYASVSLAYLEKISNQIGSANSGTQNQGYANWSGCIATFKAAPTGSTIVVSANDRYAGSGSKQTTVSWNGANVIMQVQSNVPNNLSQNAIIENLIIDGQSQPGTTGILLRNVYNCTIRNLTILNCDVGIQLDITDGNWSQANRIEHIRMTNVKTGILFTGTTSANDFGFTIIDDVGIKLRDNTPSAAGIQISTSGGPIVKLYSSFIKATVWLGNQGGTGMLVDGEVKYSLVNLEVEGPGAGTGVQLDTNENQAVYNNQSFMLTYGGTWASIWITHGDGTHDIVARQL